MAVIGISGKIGSGKDTVGIIIQYLVCESKDTLASHQKFKDKMEQIKEFGLAPYSNKAQSGWEIKKFAGKLKEIVAILTGCRVEDLERQEFKDTPLGTEWSKYVGTTPTGPSPKLTKVYESMTYRTFLQKVGTDALRNVIHEEIWVNALFADYKGEFNQYHEDEYKSRAYPNWIITDMRFPNELKAVEDRDGITIRINRKWVTYNTSFGEITEVRHIPEFDPPEHPSETALDGATFKYTIDNNGTVEELIAKVEEILKKEKII